MKQLLRACGLILGFSAPILCAPSGPPAGNYIQNISTNALTQIFNVSSGTVTGQITVGSCALIGGGSCGSGGGSGGLPLPGGATNYIQVSTGTLQAGATFYVSSGTVAGPFIVRSTMTLSLPPFGSVSMTGTNSGLAIINPGYSSMVIAPGNGIANPQIGSTGGETDVDVQNGTPTAQFYTDPTYGSTMRIVGGTPTFSLLGSSFTSRVTFSSTTLVTSPSGLNVTYGVTAGSYTITGNRPFAFVNPDGNTYNAAGSSATPVTVGHVPVYTSTGGVIGDSGLTPGSGGGGGTPGGSDTQVQYDSAGVFAGSALETFVPSSSPTAINFNNVSSVTYSGFPSIVASTGVLIDFSTDSVLTGYLYASSFTIIASTPTLYDNHGNKLLYETWNESNLYAGALTGNTTGTGHNNTAMGYQTFAFDTTGSNNTIYGYDAGQDITVGSNNVYSGIQSGYFAAQGSNNTAVGASSLYANTYGSNNTAVGYYTLSTSTAATANSAVGYGALQNVTSSSNTAVGYTALLLESTGYMNVGVGFDAGYDEQGSSNVYIGANAGPAGASNLQNSVAIGYGVIASSSNAVVIGNTSVTTMVLNGNVNLSTATFTGQTFATLGTAANGTFEYCSDCTVTTPSTCVGVISAACVCAGSGSGAFAKRLNATWYCN